MTPTRHLIHPSGRIEPLPRLTLTEIRALIGADALEAVLLRDRLHVMRLDAAGYDRGLPINPRATALLHAARRSHTPHAVRGPVVISPNADSVCFELED